MSARRGWLPRAAISMSREWAAIGEVAPLLLAAGAPKAPHLRIHTIDTNRSTALIPSDWRSTAPTAATGKVADDSFWR